MSIRKFLQVIVGSIKKALAEADFSAPIRFKKLEEREFKVSLGTNNSIYTWGTVLFLSLGFSSILYTFSSNYRRLIPSVLGVAETSFELPSQRAFDAGYDDVKSTDVLVASDSVQLSAIDGWWDTSYVARKQITLKNLSPETLDATSSLQFTINTKELFDNGRLQADCDDLRVAYDNAGTHSEIPRSFHIANGATNCSDSTATIITVENQADILTTESDTNYYIYYGNDSAAAPSSQDDGYNIGSANATLICPFNGTTTCIDGETPSTETGAIRYETGSAMEFDGVDDVVEVDSVFSELSGQSFSISTWVKSEYVPTGSSYYNQFAALQANRLSYLSFKRISGDNDKIIYAFWDGSGTMHSITSSSIYHYQLYHHVVITNDGSTAQLYVDGSFIDDETYDNGLGTGPANLTIGKGLGYMDGNIDEFAVYDKILSESEVQNLYNSGSPVPMTPDDSTVLLYHFDENGDDPRNTGKVIDASGNGNDGTIDGAHYTTGSPVPNQSYASHEGILIEEGTTNLVDNPSFENNITDLWSGKADVAAFTNGATDADGNTFLGDNNINDVFYYDTTTDSDGGAWRNDATAQASSWYSEAFSATRGHKNEFPEKAWIIATDSTVEIIDAVENKLWMRFESGTQYYLHDASGSNSSVFALNGKVYVGRQTQRLVTINLVEDKGFWDRSGGRWTISTNISGRNTATTFVQTDEYFIVNDVVNDVHAAVIDGKTYVAVATDGGVSVINETDGTVVDITSTEGTTYDYAKDVFLTSADLYYTMDSAVSSRNLIFIRDIKDITTDQTISTGSATNSYRTTSGGISYVKLSNYSGYDYVKDFYITEGTSTIDGSSNTIYVVLRYEGLTILQEKQGDESNGSVKYYTKDEITEEMVGDIRGAWGFNTNSTLSNGDDVQDVSVEDNDMTAVADAGGIGVVDGVRGKAFDFDGTNDYLTQKVYEDETGSTWGPETHNISLADGAAMVRAGETLGSELVTNGGFETYTGTQDDGVSDTFSGWSQDGPGHAAESTTTTHDGTNASKLTYVTDYARLYQTNSVTAGELYELSFWTRGDGTNAGQYQIWDVTNGGNILARTSTEVTSTSYTQVAYYFTVPSGCTRIILFLWTPPEGVAYYDDVSIKQITSPDLSDYATAANDYMLVMKDGEGDVAWGYIDEATTGETLGSELVTNGGFEDYTGTQDDGTTDTITSWNSANLGDTCYVDATATVHGGNSAVKLVNNGGCGGMYFGRGFGGLTIGKLYKVAFYSRGDGVNQGRYSFYSGSDLVVNNAFTGNVTTDYQEVVFYFTATSTGSSVYLTSEGTVYYDDFSLKEVTSLPSDGVKIMSTKGGVTQNWAGIDADFNYNASSYTFEVRKTDFQITGDLTVGAWVNKDVSDSYKQVLSFGQGPWAAGWRFGDQAGFWAFNSTGGNVVSDVAVQSDEWVALVFSWDGSLGRIYINGEENNSSSITAAGFTVPGSFSIGAGNAIGALNAFPGLIDEPFITAEALTADQIKNMFDTGCRAMGGTPGTGTCTGIDESSTTNKLAGDSNVINAVWASPTGSEIYVGSDGSSGAISVLQGNADVLTSSFTTATSPALVNNDTTSIAVTGSSTSVPTMIVGSETAGVSVLNSDRVSETQSIVNKKFGSNSLMLGNSNSVFDTPYSFNKTLTATDYTLSFYAYTNGNQSTTADIVPLIDSQPVADATYEDVGGGWTRVSKSFTGTTEADQNFGVQVKTGKTAYVDGVQLENKAYATTYCDGSLGSGYSWSGTANNSNSVRNRADLRQLRTNNLSATGGTISFWMKTKWDSNDNLNHTLFDSTFSANRFYLYKASNNWLYFYPVNSLVQFSASYTPFYKNTWNFFTISYDQLSMSIKMYINNQELTTGRVGSEWVLPTYTGDIFFGSNFSLNNFLDGVLSDLRIYDQPLTADEVSDLYNQGLATHSNGSEIGKYDGISDATYYSGRIDMNAVSSWSATDDIAVASTLNGGTADIYTCTKNLVTGTCTEAEYVPLVGNEIQSKPARYMFVKTVLNPADTFTTPVLNGLTFNYLPDNTPPTNPTEIHAYATNTKETEYQVDDYGNSDRPYFEWPKAEEAGGASDAGEGSSGVNGYYVYFGTDDTAVPETAGTYITEVESGNNHYQLAVENALTEKGNYYLRIQPMDNAGSIQPTAWAAFTYQFDNEEPDNPSSVSVTPAGWSKINSYEFYWPTGADGDSQLWGYCYKTGDPEVEDICIEDNSVTDIQAYQSGENIFYVRSIDNAGNKNSNYIQTTYYYNADAPSAPNNLNVEPETSDTNEYTFTWDEPSEFNGEVKGYYYSINTEPTLDTAIFTTETQVGPGPYATRQGENKFYVVAEDTAGNKNFDIYAEVSFYANTTAPGIPTNLTVSDSSDRSTSTYSLTLNWKASTNSTPEHYNIYRSADNGTFENIATISSEGYLDLGLSTDITYSYYITAEDDAGAESGNSQTVSKKPSGKFVTPPVITVNPKPEAKRTSAVITWETDRESNSFVQIGTSEVYSRTQGQWIPTTSHSVEVKGLNPSTEYHFRVQSIDDLDLIDYDPGESFSDDYTFTTGEVPKIKDLEVKDIRHTSIIVMWSTDVVSTSVVYITGGEDRTVEDMASGGTTQHTVLIDNLNAGTQYTVRVSGTDEEGNTLIGEEHSFTTPAYPSVSEVRLEQQKEAAVGTLKASWQTNVPTTSVAKYNKKNSEDIVEVSSSELVTEHELLLTGLADNSEYEIVVSGRDSFGNEARSDMQTFTTDVDTRPPKIENVIIETGIIGTGSKARAQLVISWDTDELSTSQVEFDIGAGDIEGEVMYSQKTKEDSALTTSHVVVISDLQPSQVYHLRIATKDGADNTSYSENNIAVTDEATENALELVMNSLLDTFGWLFGME